MQAFKIEGGRPLSGTVRAAGNKNGALPILAATVLASEPVQLSNVPRIRDVQTMVELLIDIGADAEWLGENEIRIDPVGVHKSELDEELCRRIRASFLLAGPLLARLGSATVPPPGGDVIGRRRLDPHIHGLAELGVEIEVNGRFEMRAPRLRGKSIFLDEASVMATENVVMAAVLAEGETVIGNAACEPHVQDLCRFLVSLGAQIEGIESNVLRVRASRSSTAATGASRPSTSRSAASSASRPRRAATSRSRTSSPRTCSRSCRHSPGSACRSRWASRLFACRPASGSRSRTTWAGRSRRWRTAPGPPSPPT